MAYPPPLAKIVAFFEALGEGERRENLIALAEQAGRHAPRPGEEFDFQDVRKDRECMDTVGVYLKIDRAGRAIVRISLGPEVQTLTRAMATILGKGLSGSRIETIANLPSDFVEKIIGASLVRRRSQTVFYILQRVQDASAALLATHAQSSR